MDTQQSDTQQRVAHRTGAAVLTVVDHHGTPLPDVEVTVEQTRHAFGFGNIGFDFVELANDEVDGAERERLERLGDLYAGVFTTATLPFSSPTRARGWGRRSGWSARTGHRSRRTRRSVAW